MQTTALNYRIIIEPETHNRKTVYAAVCPAFGVSDWGNTIDEAREHIHEAIQCQIDSMIKQNTPIPQPDSADFTITTVSIPTNSRQFVFA